MPRVHRLSLSAEYERKMRCAGNSRVTSVCCRFEERGLEKTESLFEGVDLSLRTSAAATTASSSEEKERRLSSRNSFSSSAVGLELSLDMEFSVSVESCIVFLLPSFVVSRDSRDVGMFRVL